MATERPRRHRFRRYVAPLLSALAVLVVLLIAVAWIPVREARDEWKRGRDARAMEIAQRWLPMRLWSRQYHQILAASFLTSGNPDAAAPHLRAIGHPWISAIDKADVARRLFARGRYAEFAAYDAAHADRNESADVKLYRAGAALATNRVDAAAKLFEAVDRSRVDAARYEWLRTKIGERRSGRVPIAPIPGAHIDPNETVETTLDPFVQNAALAALGSYRGSLVAIDPRTNEILAIASTHGKGIEQQYEPGSIVKVLTGLNALTNGIDVDGMFPYTCKGELMIDGRHFGDWLPQGHGTLRTFDNALAVSCNVFFADLGLRLKREKLEQFLLSAGFNSSANLGIVQAPLGRIIGPVFNNFETGFLAIGLQHESMNALHVAMLASMVANRGMYAVPRLVRQRRTIVGDVIPQSAPAAGRRIASADAAQRMVRAMVAVANDPRGTGRRAPVEGISLAMKTGTAGERKSGLEALIVAFAPVESPKIAFGIIAEDAGPAEFAGAQITHDFLERMKPRL
jgi:peptidoglycan glycosyltransferase